MHLIIRVDENRRGLVQANMTRLLLSAFALVFALAIAFDASAQIVSPVQQSYGPYVRPAEGYEPAMASSRNAVLLAWSEVHHATRTSHIRFGLLDFHGRLISPITTIPTSGRAEWPVVATDGTNFRLVYFEYVTEPRMERRYAAGVDIDASGMITNGVYRLRAYDRAPDSSFPIVYWNGSSFTFADRLIDEAAAVIDERLSGAAWTTKYEFTGCFLFHCIYQEVLELNWWAVHGVNGSYRPSQSNAAIGSLAMAGRGNYATIAWSSKLGVQYVELTNGAQTAQPVLVPSSVYTDQRPAVGCDDTHCLLAWATKVGDIYGLLYRRNHPDVAPVPIELGSQFARPHVQVLQNGRFLVSYVSTANAPEKRFAGRIVTTEPPAPEGRRRAVR
jgi:hypothetical protein